MLLVFEAGMLHGRFVGVGEVGKATFLGGDADEAWKLGSGVNNKARAEPYTLRKTQHDQRQRSLPAHHTLVITGDNISNF
jgi:hypothetical protein